MSDLVGAQRNYMYTEASETMVRKPTMRERLDDAVKRAELQLKEAQEARDIFSRNPDLERLLDIMQRGNF